MNVRSLDWWGLVLCYLFYQDVLLPTSICKAAQPPNVVFLLADDLGWQDLSCYGGEYCETPHIDRLAASGMRFTQAYSAGSICSPTRASLMTGKYPVRVGVTDYIPGLSPTSEQLETPRTARQLALEEVTLGEMFRQAGYETFYSGKWHLGGKGYEPTEQGFDHYVGDKQLGRHNQDWQVGQRMTKAFDRFLSDQRSADKPFLAYLSFHEPHIPILEYPDHIERFRSKSQELGASPAPIVERDGLTRARQDDAGYGSEVAGLDDWVGEVLASLNRAGLSENTVVVFFSDNGGLSTKALPGPTNNAPLRAGKGWLYEGGIRVPLIVAAPGHISENTSSDEPVLSIDLVPTLLELAGISLDEQPEFDGRSLAPLLTGQQPALQPRPLYWHYPHYHGSTWAPGAAMRSGRWKLIQFDHYGQVELYDLHSDLSETQDLSQKYPQRTRQMQQQLARWQAEVGAKFAIPANLQREQLVAWCIVPFDASQRGPRERASMLRDLGLTRLAYDWREEHVPSWDDELDALQAADIELTAFWCNSTLSPRENPGVQRIVEFLERRHVATQLWMMMPEQELQQITDEQQRVARAAQALRELAEWVRPLNCQVGLYNHGGWSGQPQTMVKIMQQLEELDNVGLVYNFHHAHDDLAGFPEDLHAMQPYLLCLNLNGLTPGGPKIQTFGEGELDRDILSWMRQVRYQGPVGILDHREELDARESLLLNLRGLERLTSVE